MKKVKRVLRRMWLRVRLFRVRYLRWWRSQDRKYTWRWRAANGFVALLLIVTIVMPVLQGVWEQNRYELSSEALQLTGHTDPSLAKQLTYDDSKQLYQFNKDAVTSGADAGLPSEIQKSSVGAEDKSNTKSYSLDIPKDFTKGVTYHDTNSQLSFKLVPEFKALPGKTDQGHLVFPLSGDSQAVYTLKNNGLKEDIIVPKVTEETMRFDYTFDLPKTVEVKAIPDSGGAIGIYSANPALFGSIQYGSDKDRAEVEKARINGTKDTLVFGLPAPVVKDTDGKESGSARFELNGNKLSVVVDNLESGKGPITIDPSVVVTSTSDFQTQGNNEGMIDFGTSGQITRGGLTGGSASGGWTSTNSFTSVRRNFGSAAYNGYLYILGGTSGTTLSDVQYAPINSNGTIGSWTATTSLGSATSGLQAVVYNGYMYILGGSSGGRINTVQYAPINSNGTIGSWTATTSFTTARDGHQVAVYNGYMYVLAGYDGTNNLSDVQYAPINANGTVGTWATTTSLTSARRSFSTVVYNGYIYVAGGLIATRIATVQYAPLKADGTIGSWTATTSLSSARQLSSASVYNGYLYVMGGDVAGNPVATTEYAIVNANGTIASWVATGSFTTARQAHSTIAYNGYLYVFGGVNAGGTSLNDVQYAQIDRAGQPGAFGTLTNNFSTANANICSVAYNGYLYSIGGSTTDNGNNNVTTVLYTALNSAGNNGSWTSTQPLPVARGSMACTVALGSIYIIGGYTGTGTGTVSNSFLFNTPNSNGTLNAWGSATNLPVSVIKPGLLSYANSGAGQGGLYALGGCTTNGVSGCSDVYYRPWGGSSWTAQTSMSQQWANRAYAIVGNRIYAYGGGTSAGVTSNVEYTTINSDGSLATWQSTTSLNTAIGYTNGTTVNGCIYSVGGENSSGTSLTNVQYACPNANGTISAWYNAPNLTVATTDLGVTSYNGYIYGVGGYTTSVQTTTQYAYVNNGGSGSTGTWGTTTAYGNVKEAGRAVAYGGYLYFIGGGGGGSYDAVQYAAINSDGTLGSWTSTSSLTMERLYHGAFAYNGYMYAIGGCVTNCSTLTATTEYAPINSNGSLGAWTTSTSFTTARSALAFAAYNGYAYIMGGYDGTNVKNDVQYAPINANGTLGTWTSTTSFTNARSSHNGFVYNGYLYVLAGYDAGSTYYNDVQYAPLNSNGTVGSWVYTSSFATARVGASVVAQNGFVYLMGGTPDVANALTNTQFAPISANGTLGAWQNSATLGTGVWNAAATAYNGYVYMLTGRNSNAPNVVSTSQYAPLNVISRTARYSKLIDLGNPVSVSSITYNGVLPTSSTTPGVAPISFRAAGSDGVFGSLTSSSAITSGATACLATSQNYKRYLLITITLDGSGGQAILPDSAGTLSNVTDFTVNYITPHPAPNIRLRHGQTLQTGNLSPLDTCYP